MADIHRRHFQQHFLLWMYYISNRSSLEFIPKSSLHCILYIAVVDPGYFYAYNMSKHCLVWLPERKQDMRVYSPYLGFPAVPFSYQNYELWHGNLAIYRGPILHVIPYLSIDRAVWNKVQLIGKKKIFTSIWKLSRFDKGLWDVVLNCSWRQKMTWMTLVNHHF